MSIYRTPCKKPHSNSFSLKMKEKSSLIDYIGYTIGIIVVGFILFILAWPIIDPTPNKSSTLKENAQKLISK